jgi:nucleotide-binding universal stress UspA family protein
VEHAEVARVLFEIADLLELRRVPGAVRAEAAGSLRRGWLEAKDVWNTPPLDEPERRLARPRPGRWARPGEGGRKEVAMAEWRKICCPVDFSEPARRAFDEAIDLARRLGAELVVAHVYVPITPAATDVLVSSRGVLETEGIEEARELETWRVDAQERLDAPVTASVLAGEASAEIARFARENGVDLIVMGTHGRTGFRRFVLGSVAERVVRFAPCPVLVVRRKEARDADVVADEVAPYHG